MNIYIKILITIIGLLSCLTGQVAAIELSIIPDSSEAVVGTPIQITVTGASALGVVLCPILADFDEGAGWQRIGVCSGNPCRVSATNVYDIPGNYTIRVRSQSGCIDSPDPPRRRAATIRIIPPPPTILEPIDLPPGVVGIPYRQRLDISGERAPIRYTRTSGSLPPGLTLSQRGLISGTPIKKGTYRFTAQTQDRVGFITQQQYTIKITQATFSVNISPRKFHLSRIRPASKTIAYAINSKTKISTTLRSPKGEFFAGIGNSRNLKNRTSRNNSSAEVLQTGGHSLGVVNRPLTVQMTSGRASATEILTISPNISRQAERLGTSTIVYRRTFTSTVMPAATGTLMVSFEKPAAGDLRITQVKIYFNNKRPQITVKRNQKDLKAFAEIRYDGTGLLRGYWEVDGRKLEHVQRHLVYGRTVTIETPEIPLLPTFSLGNHEVRFRITDPVPDSRYSQFAKALYYVINDGKPVIILDTPENQAKVNIENIFFRWSSPNDMPTYLIEFIKKRNGKPFFAAYSKSSSYILPVPVRNAVFNAETEYFWRVRGFDRDGNPAGISGERSFTIETDDGFVPGQIVMVTQATSEGTAAISTVGEKFNLQLIKTHHLKSLDLQMAIYQTDDDVHRNIAAIKREPHVISVQPNHIFKTMSDPLTNMQNLHRIYQLDQVHKKYRGKGARVAVVDTGVDLGHNDLQAAIVSHDNFIDESKYTAEIHGTAVAGVIAATVNGFGTEGVSPDANLIAYRACRQLTEKEPKGECYTISIVRALDRAIQEDADLVNMSFGATVADQLLIRLIKEGKNQGIHFVAPVGNLSNQKDLIFPAVHPDVLAVAGTDDNNQPFPNDQLAQKSAVRAPAINVFTTIPDNQHNFLSGTSISSAVVTGLLALAHEKNGGIQHINLPKYEKGNCHWAEKLLNISICEK